jgi:hypothetical protein
MLLPYVGHFCEQADLLLLICCVCFVFVAVAVPVVPAVPKSQCGKQCGARGVEGERPLRHALPRTLTQAPTRALLEGHD